MRRTLQWAILLLIGAALLVMLMALTMTTYALGSRDVELEFLIVDADGGQPIPAALVKLRIDDDSGRPDRAKWLHLLTDDEGKARVVREQVTCEDIIRPLRGTETVFDFTRYSFTVTVPGYRPIVGAELHGTPFESKGRVDEGRFERLQFRIPLTRAPVP